MDRAQAVELLKILEGDKKPTFQDIQPIKVYKTPQDLHTAIRKALRPRWTDVKSKTNYEMFFTPHVRTWENMNKAQRDKFRNLFNINLEELPDGDDNGNADSETV